MWHPTHNQGKVPADFTYKSNQKVWLRCPGCIHKCGRHHEWEARTDHVTRNGGHTVCPYCDCGFGGFCECRSVEHDPRLYKEWHPSNPPAREVARSSHQKKYLWICPKGHPPYQATCNSRCARNTGCPVCGAEKSRRTRHPVLSLGRLDLAEEWDQKKNTKSPSGVTLGSHYQAWWVCSRNSDHAPWQTKVQNRALKGNGCPACKAQNRFKLGPDPQG